MKKLLTMVACLALCICLLGVNVVMAADPTPDFIAAEEGIELEAGLSDAQTEWADFDLTLGSEWTISGEFATEHYEGAFYRQILVKGPKDAGHFEIYLQPDGYIAMYLPDGNGGGAANAGALDDGEAHAFCFVGKDGAITFYVDGAVAEGSVGAYSTFTAETEKFKLGDLVEGGMPYTGSIKGVRIFADTAVSDDLAKKLSTVGYKPAADEPVEKQAYIFTTENGGVIFDGKYWLSNDNSTSGVNNALRSDAVVFKTDKDIWSVGCAGYWSSWKTDDGDHKDQVGADVTCKVYKFAYNFENSIKGTPVAEATFTSLGDNNASTAFSVEGTNCTVTPWDGVSGFKLNFTNKLPAGQYIIEVTETSDVADFNHYLVVPSAQEDYDSSVFKFYLNGELTKGFTTRFGVGVTEGGKFVAIDADAEVPSDAPQTGDATVVTFAVIAVVALAVVAFAKKRIAE